MGPSLWQMLIVLAIVVVLFGTKKLRNVGGDMGAAINNFRKALHNGEQPTAQEKQNLFERAADRDDQ